MPSHSPAPWSRSVTPDGTVSILDANGALVAVVHNGDSELIVAAPDLLEAAKLALARAESWIHDQLDGTSSLEGELADLEPVRAAIARATGGNQ